MDQLGLRHTSHIGESPPLQRRGSAVAEQHGGATGGRMAPPDKQRIAVVGSGIAGLGSAWLLHRAGHNVVLYESEAQCGGHTLTDETEAGSPVDLGFQVFNLTNYPNLVELFEQLGVDSAESDMSFSLNFARSSSSIRAPKDQHRE